MKFAEKTVYGTPIEIKTPTKDAAEAMLTNPSASPEQKELASNVLKYFVQELEKAPDTELDRAAVYALTDYWLEDVWSGKKLLVSQKNEGAERLLIIDRSSE
jgi:hypothetical protein